MASTAASTPEPAPAPASRPYQPVFMESMTLPRDQRKGWSPLDNPKYMGSKEKLKIFFTEQPLIPIGLTATIGFFVYGMGHFVSGKTPASNWKYVYNLIVILYFFLFKTLTNSARHNEGSRPVALVARLLRSQPWATTVGSVLWRSANTWSSAYRKNTSHLPHSSLIRTTFF